MLSLMIIIQSIVIYLVTNPILSVLCLMSVYVLVSIYFFILGAEFLSIVLIIVYVGAVSILFIFVIMMLNVRLLNLYYYVSGYYIPFSLFLGLIIFFLFSYYLFFDISFIDYYYYDVNYNNTISWVNLIEYKSNLHLLAEIFFNYYYYFLILAGLILLLAMIGAIVLTIDTNYNSKIFLSGYKKDIRFFVTRVTKKRISFWKIKKRYY